VLSTGGGGECTQTRDGESWEDAATRDDQRWQERRQDATKETARGGKEKRGGDEEKRGGEGDDAER
jgi:hypothetical protein